MLVNFVSVYLFVGVILVSTLFVFAWSKGRTKHSMEIGLLCIATAFYIFGYLMELNSVTFEKMKFWNLIQFLGMPFVPAFWLHLAWGFYSNAATERIRRYGIRFIIFVIPFITLILRMTNDLHGLYYKGMYIQSNGVMQILYLEKGIGFFVQTLYIIATLILSNLLFLLQYKKSRLDYHQKFRLLISATTVPVFALALIILDIGSVGIDYTAMVLPISVLLIVLALTKYDFLEIKYMAREKIFEDSQTGMVLLNTQEHIMDYNRSAQQFFARYGVELGTGDIKDVLGHVPSLIKTMTSNNLSKWKYEVGGEVLYYEIRRNVLNSGMNDYGYLIQIEDITEREVMQINLTLLATTDPLTGLDNQRSFSKKAEAALYKARHKESKTIAMMLDLDYFKRINDAYGHICGDYVLREFAQLMRSFFQPTDILGRVGGEEFAIIINNLTINEAFEKAEQFRKKVEEHVIEYQGNVIKLTVSIGVAEMDSDEKSLDQLLESADRWLYHCKAKGRNACACKNSVLSDLEVCV